MEQLTGLAIYGPLGLWALGASLGLVALYREIGRVRDAGTLATAKLTEDASDKLAALAKEASDKIAALTTAHTQALQAQQQRYDTQMAEMQQRLFTTVTTLSDKMSALADALTRGRR